MQLARVQHDTDLRLCQMPVLGKPRPCRLLGSAPYSLNCRRPFPVGQGNGCRTDTSKFCNHSNYFILEHGRYVRKHPEHPFARMSIEDLQQFAFAGLDFQLWWGKANSLVHICRKRVSCGSVIYVGLFQLPVRESSNLVTSPEGGVFS